MQEHIEYMKKFLADLQKKDAQKLEGLTLHEFELYNLGLRRGGIQMAETAIRNAEKISERD